MSSTEELADQIAELAAHLDSGTQRLLACIREFDKAGGWELQGAVSCAHWLSWRIGVDLVTAREKVRVARALGSLPSLDQALARGEVSYAKMRAVTRVATPENEGRPLELARCSTGAQLDRICCGYRQAVRGDGDQTAAPEERSVRDRVLPGGMVKIGYPWVIVGNADANRIGTPKTASPSPVRESCQSWGIFLSRHKGRCFACRRRGTPEAFLS